MSRRAVFLDRDGTINVEKEYLFRKEDFEFIDNVPEAIKILNDKKYLVIVVTNQAGVARGYYSESDVNILHKYINDSLLSYGAHIDEYYYCPHHPIAGIGEYKVNCNCRKPRIGLFEKAIEKFNIDVEHSWMIGDKVSDIEFGQNAGLNTILVLTGYGAYEKNSCNSIVEKDLYSAVKNNII